MSFADLPSTRTHSLGAVLELAHLLPIECGAGEWLHDARFGQILNAKTNGRRHYQEGALQIGFVRVDEFLTDETAETDFYIRARRAAESAGFQKKEAAEFVAAISELYSNIVEHSSAAETAYASFTAYEDVFEFVVADSGVGVLESLHSSPRFKDLNDCGSALELVLTEGVSRHEGESGRGRGFRPIFVGLANVSESLRFRSGDHAREIRRHSENSVRAITKQTSDLCGFFCSVLCRAK